MAKALKDEVRQRVEALAAWGVTPGLAVILVGEDEASQVYVRSKAKACADTGIFSIVERMPADTAQETLEERILELAADARVHGILVQLPLPKHLDTERALALIPPEKDVDGFHVVNAGLLFRGQPGVVACTPMGVMKMLENEGIAVKGKHAVVVGRSNIVGKPMAMLLLNAHATVTICHSRTVNIGDITRQADILVAAVGIPRFVKADMIKPGAAVMDVGISRVDGKLVGDVDFDAAREVAGWITPVPGGVGMMTIPMLLQNTVDAAEKTLC